MFKRPEDPIQKALEGEILNVLRLSSEQDGFDDNRDKMIAAACKMIELRNKNRISKDAVVAAATHVVGLLLVLQHERVHVIATKAFGLVRKIV
jgi:hypothetical protein